MQIRNFVPVAFASALTLVSWLSNMGHSAIAQAVETPTVSNLTTAAGVAAVTCAIFGLLVKPWMDRISDVKLYKPIANLATFLIAEALAMSALFVGVVEYNDVLTAFLVGAVAAAASVGLYEVSKAR